MTQLFKTNNMLLMGATLATSLFASAMTAQATLSNITGCIGANSCEITGTPPNPIVQDPNNGKLLAWDEVQNYTLLSDLRVDRVFDELASFITTAPGGDFYIKAGTVVSSHYLQWDPGHGSAGSVKATIELDSQVFAFITDDQNLFNSDAALGLPGLDYADFGLRGLEDTDITQFSGQNTYINWGANSPGDWTRLITAYSPTATTNTGNPVPEPSTVVLLGSGLAMMVGYRWKKAQR